MLAIAVWKDGGSGFLDVPEDATLDTIWKKLETVRPEEAGKPYKLICVKNGQNGSGPCAIVKYQEKQPPR